ncbi:MAG: hypothetical protein JXR77_14495 [Lentisphaeria bacterium]|nr:hypothetical protein [Lentisphaeria bacterium]
MQLSGQTRRIACAAMAMALAAITQGCLLTRLLTMPMRVGGAVLTIVPCAGDAAHEGIDAAAKALDDIPL